VARSLAAAACAEAPRERSSGSREDEIAALWRSFETFRASAVGVGSIDRAIAARRLDWLTVACRIASFPDEDTAREALLCIRDEGEDLADVARGAATSVRSARLLLEDVPAELRAAFRSASPGAVLGPVEMDGLPTIVLLGDKTPATAADPELRLRAEALLISAAVRKAAERATFLLPI
jgi:hypothetical protein